MEIIKKIAFVTLLFFFKVSALIAQDANVELIKKDINLKKLSIKTYSQFEKRYNKTLPDLEKLKKYKDTFNCSLISDYNIKNIVVKPVPKYKIKSNYDISKNIVKYINLNCELKERFFYNIYNKGSFLTTEYFNKYDEDFPIIFNCVVAQPLDSNVLTMMKLGFQEKYTVFQIEGISQVLFIVDNGIVYAITEPRLDGSFHKEEINLYFRKNRIKTSNFDSEDSKNMKFKEEMKFYKGSYFLEIKE